MQHNNLKSLILACSLLTSAPTWSSDFGCKVLLCMANPKGPMAVKECVPPIKKLYRDLFKGKPFPSCAFESPPNTAMHIQQGYERYYPCNQDYEAIDIGSESDGIEKYICRKLLGYEKDESDGLMHPIYDKYPMQRRPEPHWIEVTTRTATGQIQGQKFWYRIQKKKSALF